MQESMMGHNIIITESSRNIRTLGRNALAGKWKPAILAYILYTVCLSLPTTVFDTFFGANLGNAGYDYETGMSVDAYSQIYNSIPEVSIISGVYTLLVTGAFSLGLAIYFLALFRKQDAGVTDIFLGFEHFGKALGLFIFQGFFITLWSMIGFVVMAIGLVLALFSTTGGLIIVIIGSIIAIVMAVIASIKYSQSYYIMADSPDKSIRECVNESKIMMKGNKAAFFILNLSFIGWMLLACIPMGIIIGLSEVISMPDILVICLTIIAALVTVPVEVYIQSTVTGFYEILAGHLIKETEPAPVETVSVSSEIKSETAEIPQQVNNQLNGNENDLAKPETFNVEEIMGKKDGEQNE